MNKVKKILFILSPEERKKVSLLLFMVLIMAFLEMIGIASIMPFISVLVNPEIIETNSILNNLYKISGAIGIENKNHFLFLLGISCFLLLIISISFKALTIYVQTSFNIKCRYNTAQRLMKGYLNQPYSWFLSCHSSELGKEILTEVAVVIDRGFGSIMNLITQTIVCLVLVFLVLLVEFKLTLLAFCSIGFIYLLIYYFSKIYTKNLGRERLYSNGLSFRALVEAFGAFKEVKVGGLEKACVDRFSSPSKILAKNSAKINFISLMPRLIIEALVFGGIILIILYLMSKNGSIIEILPVISIYAIAAYRIIPAMQGIYSSITQLRYIGPAIDSMYNNLKNLNSDILIENKEFIRFNNNIELNNVFFKYPNSHSYSINGLSLSIPINSTVGLVGKTGSGKTTTADIILGLLEVQKGQLKVDGQVINKHNSRAWQNNIGYVPQQIYLADTTILNNIAFGVDQEKINYEDAKRAAKIANIHDFIDKELPLKYNTIVGERGVRLSGGQRQRIGIARALYHKPKVLILDEATSALDNYTENLFIKEIYKLKSKITMIIIAHRLSTIKNCDRIFLLKNGIIKKQGSYSEIITDEGKFDS